MESNDVKIAVMQKDISQIKEDVADLRTTLKDFVKTADERYAPKWVADALKWAIALIVGTVILAVLGLVITQTK